MLGAILAPKFLEWDRSHFGFQDGLMELPKYGVSLILEIW